MNAVQKQRGTLFLVVGPSGAGKDSLLAGAQNVLQYDSSIVFARRCITRPSDAGGELHAAMSRAQDLLARLPDATRAEYGSPDKLVALMLAKDAAALTGMQVLGQRDISPDVVGVRVRMSNEEGKTKETGLGFRKSSDGLKLIITEDVVKKYAGQLGGKG